MANWYDSLVDYDVNRYIPIYNTKRLVDGDITDNLWNPWISKLPGFDLSHRYLPTTGHGSFGEHGPHYTYTLGVEKLPYYKQFGDDLIQDGKFTPMGEAWAKAVDALLPPNSSATFYDNNGEIRESWNTTYKDAHGKAPRTFTNLADYVNYVRNDQILGARHNIFLKEGKRYFYKDSNGLKHWVNPKLIDGYTVSENPVELGWNNDKTIFWSDYELTGPKNSPYKGLKKLDPIITPSAIQVPKEMTPDASKLPFPTSTEHYVKARHQGNDSEGNWKTKFFNKINKYLPDILSLGRYATNIANNDRVYNEEILGIRPSLKQSYHTYRQVVGDEAGKLNYYRRANQIQTRAGYPTTADATLLYAMMMLGYDKANELKAQGDLVDNQEVRRTSDESSQHRYANEGRDTEVANYNIAAINDANARIHNLIALKYSANQTSLDNLLQGILYKLTAQREDDDQIRKQIQLLDYQEMIENDQLYQNALRRYKEASKDISSKEYQDAKDNLAREQRRLQRLRYESMLNHSIYYGKSGTKVTYKRKDDLYYKNISDAVKHFREMSKLSLKSLDRKPIKIDKLMQHPKKMLQGGVAPFTIYKPLILGGERSTETSTSSDKSSSGGKSDSQLDLIKDLFKNIDGLPVDVNTVGQSMLLALDEANLLGLSSSDLATIYLQQMLKISNLKFSHDNYKHAQQLATQNQAMGEIAVSPLGGYILQDRKTGQITVGDLNDLKDEKYVPLTNYLLLMQRAYNPKLAGLIGDELMQAVSNGVGMEKIISTIKSMLPSLGSDESVIEGYTKALSNDIKQGIRSLLEAPDGVYKQSTTTKNSLRLLEMALNYIINMLPQNMKSVLIGRAVMSDSNPINFLKDMIGSSASSTTKIEYDAITGKGASSKSGSGQSSDNNSAALAFVQGLGPRELINFNIGTSNNIQVLGIKGALQTHSGENLGQGSTLLDATKSTLGAVIDWNKATFGGSRLNPLANSHVILNDSTIIGMDLPYIRDFNGNEIPDFLLTRKMEEADLYIYENKITDPNKINEIYRSKGLADKFINGKLNTLKYKRFAAIQVTLDEQSLKDKNAILSDEVLRANDVERDLYILTMRNQSNGDKKYDLSDGFPFLGLGKDELYKGTIFVPYSEDIAFAGISAGKPFDLNLPNNVAAIQEMQYAPKASLYKAPELTLSQIKNN